MRVCERAGKRSGELTRDKISQKIELVRYDLHRNCAMRPVTIRLVSPTADTNDLDALLCEVRGLHPPLPKRLAELSNEDRVGTGRIAVLRLGLSGPPAEMKVFYADTLSLIASLGAWTKS